MLLIAGLGNPGPTYARNRHNIGFLAVDEIARRWGFSAARSRFHSLAAEGALDTPDGPVRALILKPQHYYNASGSAVVEDLKNLTVHPEDMVLVSIARSYVCFLFDSLT